MSTGRPSNRIASLVLAVLLGASFHLAAQQPHQTSTAAATPLTVYDVVAIHENKSGAGVSGIRPIQDGFIATNVTLVTLLTNAYNIRPDLMSGLPGWDDSVAFDVNAKVSDPDVVGLKKLSGEQRRAMIVELLEDRFHLRTHIETKPLPVYDLVIAKSGSKLKEDTTLPSDSSKPGSLRTLGFGIGGSEMTGVAVPISMLTPNLAFQVERNVIDKTGLTGKYDFTLKWTPAELQGKTGSDDNAPDLFTALQEQLGLKLEASKGPVQTLVIDHVEMPTAN